MSPRIITTAADLNASSWPAIILCEGDRTGEGIGNRAFYWKSKCLTDGQISYYRPDGVLEDFETVTVLWEPGSPV